MYIGDAPIVVPKEDDPLLIFFEDTRCLQTWNGVESTWENVYCMLGPSSGPTLLGIQDFEILPSSPELVFIENTAGSYQTGNGTSPNTNTYIDGRSYGVVNGDADVDFGPVDASSYSTASLKFASLFPRQRKIYSTLRSSNRFWAHARALQSAAQSGYASRIGGLHTIFG